MSRWTPWSIASDAWALAKHVKTVITTSSSRAAESNGNLAESSEASIGFDGDDINSDENAVDSDEDAVDSDEDAVDSDEDAFDLNNIVELNEDVRFMIVEHITMPSDLQALCLVSRTWNISATQALYRKIVLDISLPLDQVTRFEECMEWGALDHLSYAKDLTFYDASLVGERTASKKGRGDPEEDDDEAQAAVRRILKLFPENKLTTFRYASHCPMWKSSMHYLEDHQKSIRNLHTDTNMHEIGCDLMSFAAQSGRKITSTFNDTEAEFIDFLKQLKSLDFLGLNFRHASFHTDFWKSEPTKLGGRRISTKVLQMYGCMETHFGYHLKGMFDWSVLKTLILIETGSVELLFNLFAQMPDVCNLECLECRISSYSEMPMWNVQNMRTLRKFFQRNTSLIRVHLSVTGIESLLMYEPDQTSWTDDEATADEAMQDEATDGEAADYPLLWPLQNRLESLVCCVPLGSCRLSERYEDPLDHFRRCLEGICRNVPRLQEFGLNAPLGIRIDGEAQNTWGNIMMELMEPLSHLKQLRMIHLYATSLGNRNGSKRFWRDGHSTLEIEAFATSLFQWARTHCPRLEVIAWGKHQDALINKRLRTNRTAKQDGFVQQMFFVRRQKPGGQSFALRTTRGRIHDEFPGLSLPNFDPGWRIDVHQTLIS